MLSQPVEQSTETAKGISVVFRDKGYQKSMSILQIMVWNKERPRSFRKYKRCPAISRFLDHKTIGPYIKKHGSFLTQQGLVDKAGGKVYLHL